jgi:hypothetical protein
VIHGACSSSIGPDTPLCWVCDRPPVLADRAAPQIESDSGEVLALVAVDEEPEDWLHGEPSATTAQQFHKG